MRPLSRVLAALTAVAIVGSGLLRLAAGAPHAPVIGGTVPGGAWRDVVGLTSSLGLPYCSGILVSPRVVLTAAHCLDRTPAMVYVGSTPVDDGTFTAVESAVAHPAYDVTTHVADLGVVVLARPVPIPPRARARDLDGATKRLATFVGFGFTEPGPGGLQGIKHAGEQWVEALDSEFLRFGMVGCNGDSGGALLIADDGGWVLGGIISHGDAHCVAGGAAVRVDTYAAWIDQAIADLDPASCALDLRCVPDCADLDCEVSP